MISIAEAQAHVRTHAHPLPAVVCPSTDILGTVLASPIVSSVDSPPHDKSLVDGYAVRAAEMGSPGVTLTVLEEVTAGMVPSQEVRPGTATRIMTGAPIPKGADCVIMVEETTTVGDSVTLQTASIQRGANIMPQATSIKAGTAVLEAGHRVRSVEMGLIAELGIPDVSIIPKPRVAVLATGNELVPVGHQIRAGQIRNSNGPMLSAMVAEYGALPNNLGIARDDQESLTSLIREGLSHDVLLLSGGVSAGVLDLVPATLERLGVKQVFHRVAIRPGKPVWFGVFEAGPTKSLVFGLPGNPVSSLVCFHVFVELALSRLAGGSDGGRPARMLPLATSHRAVSPRPTYHPARRHHVGDATAIEPLRWHGSADLATLSMANCFAFFDGSRQEYAEGELVSVHDFFLSFE